MRGALLVLLALAGCGKKESGGDTSKDAERPPLAGRVHLEDLVETYRTNEAKADSLYGNRRITYEGAMKNLAKTGNELVATFENDRQIPRELPVVAYFPMSAGHELAKLKLRSPVRFTGRCDGWEKNVHPRAIAIRDCKLEPWPEGKPAEPAPKSDEGRKKGP